MSSLSTFGLQNAIEMEQRMAALEASLSAALGQSPRTGAAFNKNNHLAETGEQEMTTTDSVALAMRIMDARYATEFGAWIKKESNVDYIAHHLKKLVGDYDVPQMARAFRWLFEDWSMTSIAGVLIKIFYDRGLDDVQFAQLVGELCTGGQPWEQSLDMISTLVIGEEPQVTARFLHTMTASWACTTIVELVDSIAKRSQWPTAFYEAFVAHYASLDPQMSDSDALIRSRDVLLQFRDRHAAVLAAGEYLPADLAHRLFATKLFEQIVQHELFNSSNNAREARIIPTTVAPLTVKTITSGMSSPLDCASVTSPSKDPRSPRQIFSPTNSLGF